MSTIPVPTDDPKGDKKHHPFRRAMLRGMAIVMPALLTVIVFVWAMHMIVSYVLVPLESVAHAIIQWSIEDVQHGIPQGVTSSDVLVEKNGQPTKLSDVPLPPRHSQIATIQDEAAAKDVRFLSFQYNNRVYVPVGDARLPHRKGEWIPDEIYDEVQSSKPKDAPTTASAYYGRYVHIMYLRRAITVPVFLVLFMMVLYMAGKLFAAGIGRVFVNLFERIIHRLPIIRTVYSAAKQVTDFIFKEREVEFTRVVAVEYPRKGIWSMGFVTGESFLDIRSAANEPVLSVLMPTSPMPATGFTITVPKSETIDLDITIDQAVQFCVSCGVVVPPNQQWTNRDVAELMKSQVSTLSGQDGKGKAGAQREVAASTADDANGDT